MFYKRNRIHLVACYTAIMIRSSVICAADPACDVMTSFYCHVHFMILLYLSLSMYLPLVSISWQHDWTLPGNNDAAFLSQGQTWLCIGRSCSGSGSGVWCTDRWRSVQPGRRQFILEPVPDMENGKLVWLVTVVHLFTKYLRLSVVLYDGFIVYFKFLLVGSSAKRMGKLRTIWYSYVRRFSGIA